MDTINYGEMVINMFDSLGLKNYYLFVLEMCKNAPITMSLIVLGMISLYIVVRSFFKILFHKKQGQKMSILSKTIKEDDKII